MAMNPVIARVYQQCLPLAQQWGGGDVASADALRFVTPVRTLNAGPNRKYFGSPHTTPPSKSEICLRSRSAKPGTGLG